MKKFIYSLVLCALAAMPAVAQETITVHDGNATNGNVPVYGFYADAYNKCEMIMPADDLSEMTGATITKMTWYLSSPAAESWGTAVYQIYLKEVSENAFTDAFIGTDGATLVYEGALDGTGETMVIEFSNDYTYDGGNLFIAVYQVAKGTYKSASFAGAEAAGAAISSYNYDSLDGITATSSNVKNFLPKTTFEFIPGSGPVYYKPKNIQIVPGVNDAVVTWEAGADETSWAVEYKKAADEEWTPAGTVTEKTITLDALANSTAYEVRVKAIYADGESGWTTASFATLACEATDMGEVEYVLTDTYGDGWNGNKLQIFLHGTDIMVADLAIPNASDRSAKLLEGTVNLCYGVDYDLVWVAGSYAYETGFTVTAPDGTVIYEFHGTGSSSDPTPAAGILTTFQIKQVTCPRPTDVVASNVTYNSATLSWTPGTEEQDLFEVIYGKGDFDPDAIDMVPVQVNEPTITLTELEENAHYTVYVRSVCSEEDQSTWTKAVTFDTPLHFPLPEDLAVNNISAKSAVAEWAGQAANYNLRYREVAGFAESFEDSFTGANWMAYDATGDGWGIMPIAEYQMGGVPLVAADGESCISSCSVDDNNAYVSGDAWIMTEPVELNGTLKFYVADLGSDYTENFSVYVAVGEGNSLEDYQKIGEGTTPGMVPAAVEAWAPVEFDLSEFEGETGRIAIVHNRTGESGYYLFVDNMTIVDESADEIEWTVVQDAVSPATMAPLKPLTKYEVQVQGVYEDGLSAWTESVIFTTLAADAMPSAVEIADITDSSAKVNIEGSQDSYNIRYRTAAKGFMEDFEGIAANGDPAPEGWTTIDADGDGNNWFAWYPASVNVSETDNAGNPTVIDHICMTSASYGNNVALTPDNWLITPQVELGGTLSIMYRGQDPSWAGETFAVYVSTTGTAIDDFVELVPKTTAGATYAELTADLSEYEGEQGYIAIRHYDCTDMFRLNIDNVAITQEGQEAGEWITVENVTELPYIIEGLDPETKYEVQVQGVVDEQTTTDWTKSVFFTTLPKEEGMDEFYLVGTFCNPAWSPSEGEGRIEFVKEDDAYVANNVVLEAGAEFKIITPAEDGGWIWYGGEHADTDEFLVMPQYYNNYTEITLVPNDPKGNFKMEYGPATYKITIKKASNGQGIGPKALQEPIVMVMEKTTGIDNINVDKAGANEWYNLNGQKLNGKPSTPGIYINGGKKVIVR